MKNKCSSIAKQAAGEEAAKLIQEGMLVGLGSGSTSVYFIESLGRRCREGLKIHAVATSLTSEVLARKNQIPLIDINQLTMLDIDVDGVDEIDANKRMIKGGGAALLREKVIATMSREMIVIADETKIVTTLGRFPLPLEILPFGHLATCRALSELGYLGHFRMASDGKFILTDNGNYLLDLSPREWKEPEKENAKLLQIPGVIETGFFFNLAGRVIIGLHEGGVKYI